MKIVINRCYGGFGLSRDAILEMYRRGSKAVEWTPFEEYYSQTPDWKERRKRYLETNDIYDFYIEDGDGVVSLKYDYEIRNDPILVEVVEEMGAKSWGRYAELRVVEIPDGVEYEIDDYDGMESVHEKHRSWVGDD